MQTDMDFDIDFDRTEYANPDRYMQISVTETAPANPTRSTEWLMTAQLFDFPTWDLLTFHYQPDDRELRVLSMLVLRVLHQYYYSTGAKDALGIDFPIKGVRIDVNPLNPSHRELVTPRYRRH